jgi:spore maturation protein CgeB
VKLVLFYHSLVSDWNHGNAHFLRGVATELIERGHEVVVYEPRQGWSLRNLRSEHGEAPVRAFHAAYPRLRSEPYDLATLDLDAALDGADVVIVHEWNDPALVRAIGRRRAASQRFRLLFHDTHHRAVSAPQELSAYDLSHYDGVLAFGEVLRQLYERRGWAARAWTWHEAADTRVFRPLETEHRSWDVAWIGNWGDGERTRELEEFLIGPIGALGLRALVYGVRYPADALARLEEAGIEYGGWVANFRVPQVFASARATVHVPRRFYREQLPGIPTIRIFEALACGIPLVSAPWRDEEGLFGREDFLLAADGAEMRRHLRRLIAEPAFAEEIAARGQRTVLARHTCAHRVSELLEICASLRGGAGSRAAA